VRAGYAAIKMISCSTSQHMCFIRGSKSYYTFFYKNLYYSSAQQQCLTFTGPSLFSGTGSDFTYGVSSPFRNCVANSFKPSTLHQSNTSSHLKPTECVYPHRMHILVIRNSIWLVNNSTFTTRMHLYTNHSTGLAITPPVIQNT